MVVSEFDVAFGASVALAVVVVLGAHVVAGVDDAPADSFASSLM